MQKGNYKLGYHHDWDSNILLPAMTNFNIF